MPLFRNDQVVNPVEWRDQTRLVRGQHLLHERQQCCQHVVCFEAALRGSGFEEFQKWDVGGITHGARCELDEERQRRSDIQPRVAEGYPGS